MVPCLQDRTKGNGDLPKQHGKERNSESENQMW